MLGKIVRNVHATLPLSLRYFLARLGLVHPVWRTRIADVQSAPDNTFIPRLPMAGETVNGHQIMHNGLRIERGSYYGAAVWLMLKRNRGVHEPQEERVFGEVLESIDPGSVMLELGAYWGFYSMWFAKAVPDAKLFLVEPKNIEAGRRNLALNDINGTFIEAYVGERPFLPEVGTRVVSVDSLVDELCLGRIAVLHSDIQGAEVLMLRGAENTMKNQKIDFVFISTHSQGLHVECLDILRTRQFHIIATADMHQTYSYDGLIVARRRGARGPDHVDITLKGAE